MCAETRTGPQSPRNRLHTHFKQEVLLTTVSSFKKWWIFEWDSESNVSLEESSVYRNVSTFPDCLRDLNPQKKQWGQMKDDERLNQSLGNNRNTWLTHQFACIHSIAPLSSKRRSKLYSDSCGWKSVSFMLLMITEM